MYAGGITSISALAPKKSTNTKSCSCFAIASTDRMSLECVKHVEARLV